MPFVLDASVAAVWAFDDEDHPVAAVALLRLPREGVLVPGLWWFEIANTLIVNERRGRIASAETDFFLRRLIKMDITVEPSAESAAAVALARRHKLTVYDASYLELALREGVALATIDKAIMRAARAEQVPLVGFDSFS